VLRTAARTKDYFTAPVREAERLGVRERRVRVREGLELNVAEGPAGGIPLLLIPGQGVVRQEYARALPALLEACHVFVVDFPAQDWERDWVCWYMPGRRWARVFGPLWRVFTRIEVYTDALLELVDRVTAGEGARTDDGAAGIDGGAAGIAAGGVAGIRSTGLAEENS